MDEKLEIDLREDEFAALADQASVSGRSVAQEAAAILRQHLRRPMVDRDDLIARARAIRAMTPRGVPQTDSLTLLREDRDR